ncbi:MAG: TonB-dependent receptor, partial [Alphaproteobacteria bacterium]|nr:TonB-dependent receptor [Alphaproteobacteria bacterium]
TGVEAYRRKWDGVNTRRSMGVYSAQHMIPDPVSDVAGAYAQYQHAFSAQLHLTAGARLDGAMTGATAADASTDLYWAYKGTRSKSTSDVMPSASIWAGYTRGPVEFFLGAGHTARIPDPVERYISFQRMGTDWVGNPALRPTRNTETDARNPAGYQRSLARPFIHFLHHFPSRHADHTVPNCLCYI